MAAHQVISILKTLDRKYTQTNAILSRDATTQTDSIAIKLENELIAARNSLKQLNSRLGDELIESDNSSDSSDSSGRQEENFSDASENEKQIDNRFSLKYGFITNVRHIIIYNNQHHSNLVDCLVVSFSIARRRSILP